MKKKEYVVVNYTVTFAAPFKFCGVHYLKGIPYCFTAHLAADVYGITGMTPGSLAEFDRQLPHSTPELRDFFLHNRRKSPQITANRR